MNHLLFLNLGAGEIVPIVLVILLFSENNWKSIACGSYSNQ